MGIAIIGSLSIVEITWPTPKVTAVKQDLAGIGIFDLKRCRRPSPSRALPGQWVRVTVACVKKFRYRTECDARRGTNALERSG
jgi:hypothetical protein